ncbi:cation diffusion facilitator family transporter [Nannocystaceae bacterium ST9]
MSAEHGTGHIIQSLIVNTIIAAAKLIAAVFTKSGSMLAEGIHSTADCGNQLLLLWGVKQGQRPADDKHPLGYGRNVYFWSFMVALLLFTGGGVFSIYEGIHKLANPEPVDHVEWAIAILGFSLLLEGWATYGNVKQLNGRRKTKPFFQFLRDTKDSDLVVVFGENSAAVLGLAIALLSIVVTMVTGDTRADAIGSLLVGLVLVAVAVFLAVEVKSLLVGESADPEIKAAAEELARVDPRIQHVISCITMQQGPGEVLVAVKIQCEAGLTVVDISNAINEFEARLRAKCPEAKWVYVEPDLLPDGPDAPR